MNSKGLLRLVGGKYRSRRLRVAPRPGLRPTPDRVIETLFNYTGMGWLTYQALLNRDIPLIQAAVFVIAAVVMLANLVVDLLYLYVDPRIRLE